MCIVALKNVHTGITPSSNYRDDLLCIKELLPGQAKQLQCI